jgi:hypothetical protein
VLIDFLKDYFDKIDRQAMKNIRLSNKG